VVQGHGLAPQLVVQPGLAQQLGALLRVQADLFAHGRRHRVVAERQVVLQAGHGDVHAERGAGHAAHRLGRPAQLLRRQLAHQHHQQRMVAAVLFARVAGDVDQVVQRGIGLALADLAGALVHQAHAGDEFGFGPRFAQRLVEHGAQAFPLVGHGDVGAAQAFTAAALRQRRGDGLQRRVLPRHRAHRGAQLAPPFDRLVFVGEQRLRTQVLQLVVAAERRARGQQQPAAGVAQAEGQRCVQAQVFG
jgi:hypothetical protein